MSRGEVILFTGAGFSTGATDATGKEIPQGSALKAEIWNLIEPGSEPDPGSTLADTYAVALAENQGRLVELLESRLRVDPSSLGETHQKWLSMPWRRAYTLNIDDLESAAQRQFNLSRHLITHSGLETGLPSVNGNELLFTHLNGTMDDVPDVTFADPQYGLRALQENALYTQLAADMLSYPVVFVGTEIRESLFWQYIAMRDVRGTRGVREMRPVSFLVTPELPGDRRRMLETFNIRWVQATTDSFAAEVLAKLDEAAKLGHSVRAASTQKSGVVLSLVSELSSLPEAPDTEYLLGADPTWEDIRAGRAIEREFELELDPSSIDGCLLIGGTAGAGTSTTLKRLALRCVAGGQDVRWIGANHDFNAHELSRELRRHEGDMTLFVDDADTFGKGLRDLVQDVTTLMPNITLILGMRSARIDQLLGASGQNVTEVSVPLLEDSDINNLLRVLSDANRLGALKQLNSEQRVDRVREECNRELLVAMIEATSGIRFETKVAEEFSSLEAEQRLVYSVAAIATDLRFGLTKDQILIATGDVSNTGLYALDRLLARRFLVDAGGDNIRVRHRRLAEVVVSGLRKGGQLLAPYEGLTRSMAMRASPDDRKSREARLLTALISNRRVGASFSISECRAFYQGIEDLMRTSYHFWLQRGALELKHGNIRAAGNYLQQAKAGGDHDYRVHTEWAYFLLKSAYSDPGANDAREKVEEAKAVLLDQIESRGPEDVHVWHVYGSQILKWTREAPLSADEKAAELQVAKSKVDEGRRTHPNDRELKSLFTELERAWLMTRVS